MPAGHLTVSSAGSFCLFGCCCCLVFFFCFLFCIQWETGNSLTRRERGASRGCNRNKWSSLNLITAKSRGGRGLLSPQWLENRKFHRQRTNWRKPKNVLLGTGFAMWHRPAMITTSVLINLNEIYHAKAKWQVWSTRCLSLQDQAQVIKVSWPWKGQKKTLEPFEQLLVTSHFFFFFESLIL